MGISEVAFVVALLGGLVAPSWYAASKYKRMRWWAWFFTAVALLTLGFEISGVTTIGQSISQVFWEYGSQESLVGAWVIVIGFILAMLVLAWHLMSGVYKRRNR